MKPRILYVTHRSPWPPDRGDRIRTWNILKCLAQRADVDLLCLADEPVSSETQDALKAVSRQLAIVPLPGKTRYVSGALSMAAGRTVTEGLFHSPMAASILRRWSAETRYSAALASSSGVAGYVLPPVVNSADRVWIDLIDVDSQKWLDYSAASRFPMSWVYGLEGRRLRALECSLAQTVDRLLVVSQAECDLFRGFCSTNSIQAVNNGVDTDFFHDRSETTIDRHSCVFVGVMNYRPNADAVQWFADNVWPRLRKRFPDAKFRIVGKSPTPDVLSLADRPGIEVTGAVADVRPWLHRSECVVVPLRIARGVQNKVLEAMSAGRPVVCSPSPLKGLDRTTDEPGMAANVVVPGEHLLRADSADEWVEAVSEVFENRATAAALGRNGAEWVRDNYRWESCLAPMQEMLTGHRETRANRHEQQELEVIS